MAVWVNLLRPADTLDVKVFTTSYRLVARWRIGPLPIGGSVVALDPAPVQNLSDGVYYLSVETSHARILGKWMVLR